MLLLPDFVVQSSPAIAMVAKEHKLGQETIVRIGTVTPGFGREESSPAIDSF